MKPDLSQRLSHRLPPDMPFLMHQRWEDMLFVHWKIDPQAIQRRLPPGLYVDTFDGAAWVGVLPFYMRGVRFRCMPGLPRISQFLETNVRTYVHDDHGRSGIWLFSLDCNEPLAVVAARSILNLPYRCAAMATSESDDGLICYQTRPKGIGTSRFIFGRGKAIRAAVPGTLEFFLIERYLLFTTLAGRLMRVQVQHKPWPLAQTELLKWDAKLLQLNGVHPLAPDPGHVVSSPGVRAKVFLPAFC